MTGNDYELNVYIGQQNIAKITLINDSLYWHYHPIWQQSGYAISPHLPLYGNIPTVNVQRFLRNLLPEGQGLDDLVSLFSLSKYNTFGLIQALGSDTSGALIFRLSGQLLPQKGYFRPIANNELEQRLNSREMISLIIWDGKPRLSVAGLQDKINIIINKDNQIGFGEGCLCSTHILKFEKQQLSHLVLNEFVTMQLAKQCGLKVATVQLKRYGEHPALLIERFDRRWVSHADVKRRHIIDGCQALNLSPDHKYERNFGNGRDVAHIRDGASLVKLFDVANLCINPALTRQQILDWVLFNLVVFNCDAHGKNISFFVGFNGMELAPFYDLVNIRMYPELDQTLAMALGDEFDNDVINAYQLADFADSCQLARSLVASRLHRLLKKIQQALTRVMNQVLTGIEQQYLETYQRIITQRCVHFLAQLQDIISIEL